MAVTWRPEDWKAGDVAMVAVNDGIGWRRGFRCGVPSNPGWQVSDPARSLWVNDTRVTDARPLVVLDPESTEDAERFATELMRNWPGPVQARAVVQAALRALVTPPEPPKPEEPGDPAARVITADDGLVWARIGDKWVSARGGWLPWESLCERGVRGVR